MSGRIPRSFIDDLLARADLVELVGSRVTLRRGGRDFKGLCPFHAENTPSFTVSADKGFYHCFGCGAHGSALGFLMEHDRLSFPEAVEALAAHLGVPVQYEDSPSTPQENLEPLYAILEQVAGFYAQTLRGSPRAIEYLKGRGLDGATAGRFGIGYAPAAWDALLTRFGGDAERNQLLERAGLVVSREGNRRYDRFRDRIMFPIRDARGRIIAFGGRVVPPAGADEPKYLNSPETPVFHKGRELYGLYEARQAQRQIPRLLLVEGYMDVVGMFRHGLPIAVATLGTAFAATQLRKLFGATEEVVFCFDGDRAGRAAAWRALETALPELQQGRQMAFLFLPDGDDPDSLVAREGSDAFLQRLEHTVSLSEFLVQRLTEDNDLSSVDGRARLVEQARPLLARIPDGAYKELLLQTLANTVGLPVPRLERLLAGDTAPAAAGPQARPARAPAPSAGRDNWIRSALRLVLHYPRIVLHEPATDFLATLGRPGAELLHALIADIREHPAITPGMLLEHWKTHPEGKHLGKLLDQEMLLEEAGAAEEYAGLLARLLDASRRQRLDRLRGQASLNEAEKDELRRLQKFSGIAPIHLSTADKEELQELLRGPPR